MSSMRHVACFALAFAVAHAAVAAPLPPTPACLSTDACIASALAAAREGRHIDQLAMMVSMGRAAGPRSNANHPGAQRPSRVQETVAVGNVDGMMAALLAGNYAALPENWRMSALFLLKSNKLEEAERVLRDGISVFPTHAAFWTDLALVFGQQGKVDDAVGALLVADSWSENPAGLRQGYAQAAQGGPGTAMAPVYAAALRAIEANTAALERFDAALPAVSLTSNAGNVNKVPTPIARFDTCPMPQYPRVSARHEESGKVSLAFYVDADGKLLRVKKLASSGYIELDNAALTGIAACAFEPASSEGKSVPAWAKVEYVWSLET
jgi:TonB family protein